MNQWSSTDFHTEVCDDMTELRFEELPNFEDSIKATLSLRCEISLQEFEYRPGLRSLAALHERHKQLANAIEIIGFRCLPVEKRSYLRIRLKDASDR